MSQAAAFRNRAGFSQAKLSCGERHFPADLFRILVPVVEANQNFLIAGRQAGDHLPYSVHLLPQRCTRFRRLVERRRWLWSRIDRYQPLAPQHRSPDVQRDTPMRYRPHKAHQAGWIANFPRSDRLQHDYHNLVYMVLHRLWIDTAEERATRAFCNRLI